MAVAGHVVGRVSVRCRAADRVGAGDASCMDHRSAPPNLGGEGDGAALTVAQLGQRPAVGGTRDG